MMQYYFLSILLGHLTLDQEPEVSFKELRQLGLVNLSPGDLEQFKVFLTWLDLNNLAALWAGQGMGPTGNWTKEELLDMQKLPLTAPGFLEEFLRKYSTEKERVRHFDQLLLGYFSYAYERARGFLKEYLQYEQVLRLMIAAKRAEKIKRSFEEELVFLDQIDPWQAELYSLAHEEPDILGIADEMQEALDLYQEDFQSPLELFKQLLLLRFDKIDQLRQTYSPFSIDAIIAYAAQLEIVNRWQMTGRVKNQPKVMTILKDLNA